MDIEKYCAGKKIGVSCIEKHGESTLLIKWPAGFDPETGAALPAKEQGFQPADIQAMKSAADDAVIAALDALDKAEQRAKLFDELIADVQKVCV